MVNTTHMIDILALATDYDETLACEGRVDTATWDALLRFKKSGRKLILVTGREFDDLISVCSDVDVFDAIVVENGAVLHLPSTRRSVSLASSPPPDFIETLRRRGVQPLAVGRSIVATVRSQYEIVRRTIREMGLDLQIVFNRNSVMVLPSRTNKRTGLQAALQELRLAADRVVGIGDAENDEAFLALCGIYAVVANALPPLKQAADVVTLHDCGPGVVEIIEKIMAGQLSLALRQ
jgi:hydroxymethylpyrimidine pyrophosphatase-like HAD family hydrolase